MYYLFLSFMMISFVLFPQASLPSMNFNILELVYLAILSGAYKRAQKSHLPSLFTKLIANAANLVYFVLLMGIFVTT